MAAKTTFADPDDDDSSGRQEPATNPLDREQQMGAYADALAERQLREGTASAQVIVHYLRGATERERLEREKIANENLRLRAQIAQIESQASSAELMDQVLKALKVYSGADEDDEQL